MAVKGVSGGLEKFNKIESKKETYANNVECREKIEG